MTPDHTTPQMGNETPEPSGAVECGGLHMVSREQFDKLISDIDAEKDARAVKMPTDADALAQMQEAYKRLTELGFADAVYCPKDGTPFDAVEPGSTGIHECIYLGEWPQGGWWVSDGGDLWPSRPALWRAKPTGGRS